MKWKTICTYHTCLNYSCSPFSYYLLFLCMYLLSDKLWRKEINTWWNFNHILLVLQNAFSLSFVVFLVFLIILLFVFPIANALWSKCKMDLSCLLTAPKWSKCKTDLWLLLELLIPVGLPKVCFSATKMFGIPRGPRVVNLTSLG